MKYAIVVIVVTFSGCATPRDPFRENVQSLIDCEYKWTQQDGLTVHEIIELQAGCYSLYQMRRKP